jgi:hypothetical protein
MKGGVHNNIVDKLVSTLHRMNVSETKNDSLKDFQNLAQSHNKLVTPIFSLIFKCIETKMAN